MRRLIFTLIVISLTVAAFGQKKTKTANKKTSPWKKGGFVLLNLAQSGSRNWAGGSEKFSLVFGGHINLWAIRKAGKNTWANYADIGYSMVNTHDQGVRKLDDKLDLVTQYTYELKKKISVGTWINLRSQLTNGYDYTETKRRRISGLFAPAYIVFAPGVEWKATSYWSFFLSPAAVRWVVVTNRPYSFNYQGGMKPDSSMERPLASLYGVDPERQVRVEVGPFFTTKFNKEICKNVHYTSRLDLQSDITHQTPFNLDVYWTNFVGMRVNKWLHVTYNFDLIYEDEAKMFGKNKNVAAAQLKSMLGVGVAAKF
jgi:hypothetical protein